MPINASIFAAIFPMILYLILVWKMDKYEPEPFRFLLIHFLWGAVGAIILGILGSVLLDRLTGITENESLNYSLIQTILFAPISEEIAKGIFLFWTIRSSKFDNMTDGLVYGSAIGLGFGMTENFSYFVSYGDSFSSWLSLVIIRSGFSAVMHGISTGTLGALIGLSKFNNANSKIIYPFAGIIVAIIIHFIWNLSVSFNETFFLGFAFILCLIIFFLLLFRYAINKEKEIIESELIDESVNHSFPDEHVKIISSNLRFKKGWIDESIRKTYYRTVIKLAFKKMQYKKSNGFLQSKYNYEIEKLRGIINTILHNKFSNKYE
jgi:RsiW-degrading membrane proteinase PrsW (M82 family)